MTRLLKITNTIKKKLKIFIWDREKLMSKRNTLVFLFKNYSHKNNSTVRYSWKWNTNIVLNTHKIFLYIIVHIYIFIIVKLKMWLHIEIIIRHRMENFRNVWVHTTTIVWKLSRTKAAPTWIQRFFFFKFFRVSKRKYVKENPEENHSSLLTTEIDKTSRSGGLLFLNSVSNQRSLPYVAT